MPLIFKKPFVRGIASSVASGVANTLAPVLSGINYTGQTITVTRGTWEGGAATGVLYADGVDITSDMSGDDYVMTHETDGQRFVFVETLSGVTADSNAIYYWTEANIEMQVVFDAKDPSTLTVDENDLISQWDDKSGNDRHLTQGVQSKQGVYDSGTDSITIATDTEMGVTPSITLDGVIAVVQYKDGVDTTFDLFSTLAHLGGGTIRGVGGTDQWQYTDYKDDFVNGAAVSTTTALPMPKSLHRIPTPETTAVVGVLSHPGKGTRGFEGSTYAYFVPAPNEAMPNIQRLEGRLAHLHGITLAPGHPYENTPPVVVATDPVIEGIGYTGQTLTVKRKGISPNGSIATGQWFADGVAIAGETGLSLLVSYLYNGAAFTYVESVDGGTKISNEIHNWTPADITVQAWYEANDPSTLTVDGGNNISQWDDKSGNDHHLVQAALSKQGVYDVGSDSVSVSSSAQLGSTGAISIDSVIAVLQYKDGLDAAFDSFDGTVFNQGQQRVFGHVGQAYWYTGSASTDESFVDGADLATASVLPMPKSVQRFAFPAGNSLIADVLWNSTGASLSWNGTASTFIIPATGETTTNIKKLEAYCAYSTGLTLDAAHTYASAPPTVGA